MNGRWVWVVLLVLLLVVGGVVLSTYAYNMGVAQGLAQSDKLPAPTTGVLPYGPYLFHPFGFWGFGFLGLLFPLFFFLLIFAVLRGIFWGGRRGWHRHDGMMENHVPPRLEEWHRKMHESKP